MTRHVVIAGIDGSGKSTLARQLPLALTAELGVSAGRVGDEVAAWSDAEDYLQPGFVPSRLPLAARVARRFRRLAKRWADGRKRYVGAKIAQLWAQDRAAHRLARDHALDVIVRDGETWLAIQGRGGNYLHPASRGSSSRRLRLVAFFLAPLLWLWARRRPDIVLFLDLPPELALRRIDGRGRPRDGHENLADLEQAQNAYLRALAELQSRGTRVVLLDGRASPQAILAQAVAALSSDLSSLAPPPREGQLVRPAPRLLLRLARRMLRPSYLALLLRDRGCRRELWFPFSRAGRRLLREGYSAEVMRLLYHPEVSSRAERAFHRHPLHRAVSERRPRVVAALTRAIDRALADHPDRPLRILTGPSGTLDDIDDALADLDLGHRDITLWSVDLDPAVARDAARVAARHGLRHHHLTASLTEADTRATLLAAGPFDVVVFVGLSSWLPKRALLTHLRLCRRLLASSRGALITDAFGPAPYATSGRVGGFSASYYDPPAFESLLALADLGKVHVDAAPLNRVVVAQPLAA
ncbi:MAG: hypothetical protein R3B72_09090 [Polyangiaceae bacterium]